MKKLAIVLLLVAACHRQIAVGSPTGPDTPGAATPRGAVEGFLTAAKAQDVQAMGLIWGTAEGPAITVMQNSVSREQKEIIMMCYLRHDSYQITGEQPATGGERAFDVEIKLKDLTRKTNFAVTRGPSDRWYVRQFDIEPLRDLCAQK